MRALRLPLSLRFALRELRGGLSGFYIFIACIALGVAAIAGVNSVSRAMTDGIAAQGRVILGGDLSFSLVHREASPAELRFFEEKAQLGQIATMRAMVRRADEEDQTLVELKAVDSDLSARRNPGAGGRRRPAAASRRRGRHVRGARRSAGARQARHLRRRPHPAWHQQLQVRGVIRTEPDLLSSGVSFGPRLIVSLDALRATGLVRPGSLITWTYRLDLPAGKDGSGAMGRAAPRLKNSSRRRGGASARASTLRPG